MQEGKALSIQMDKIFGELQRFIQEWNRIRRQIFQSGSRLAWHQFKKKTINIVKQLNKSEQQDEISQDEPEQRAAEEEENIENQENEEGILQDQNQRENEISNSLLKHQSQLQQQQADQTQSKCMHFQLDAQDMNLNLNQSLIRNIQDSSISHYQENIRAEVNLDGCIDNSYEGPKLELIKISFIPYSHQYTDLQSQSINQQNNQSGVSRQQKMNYELISKKLKTQKRPQQNIIVTRQQESSLFKQKQKQQEKCDYHNLKVWYDCTNDKKKGKKLCNKCLTDSKDHFRHNVICKVHRGPLKMAIIKEEQNLQEETQKFYCEKCSKNQMQTYKAICQKHFRLIKYVCFDKKCIDNKQFSICELCEHNHQHLLTNFQEDQLQQKVKCRKELHQKQIQKYLDKIKQKLHMRIFFKPFSIRSQINNPFIFAIEQFDGNKLIQFIQGLITNLSQQNMKLLFEINKVSQTQKSEEYQRHLHLQVFNDRFVDLQTEVYNRIQGIMKDYDSNLEQLLNLNQQQISEYLHNKYKNVYFDNQTAKPLQTLQQIMIYHYKRIQTIVFKKPSQQNERQNQLLAFKIERIRLYQKIQHYKQKNPQAYKILIKMFHTPNKITCEQDQKRDDESLTQVGNYQIQYSKCCIQKQNKQRKECREFKFVSHPQLVNLRQISLIYQLQAHFIHQKSEISMFQIIKLIKSNKNLQKIEIDGVYIDKFQKFITLYYGEKENILLNGFKFPQNFKLSICAELSFILKNEIAFKDKANSFMHFIKQIGYISNIKIDFDFNHFQGDFIQRNNMIDAIRKIDEKRISLKNYHFYQTNQNQSIKDFMKNLVQIPNITELNLQRINIKSSFYINQQTFSKFTFLLQNVKYLHIKQCRLDIKPCLKKVIALTLIQEKITFCDLGYSMLKHIENPILLRFVDLAIVNNQIDLSKFTNIEFLKLSNVKGNPFSKIMLKISPCNSIKHLTLLSTESSTIRYPFLFSQLTCIVKLHLRNIQIQQELIRSIPSISLEDLSIEKIKGITNGLLQTIDKKFKLRQLTIKGEPSYKDPQAREDLFEKCKFSHLLHLKINEQLASRTEDSSIVKLRTQGVIVTITS